MQRRYSGIGIALGVAIGAALGVSQDNLALGVGVGIALGVAVGASLDARRTRRNGSSGTGDGGASGPWRYDHEGAGGSDGGSGGGKD